MSKHPAVCTPRGAPPQHGRKLCLQHTEGEPGHISSVALWQSRHPAQENSLQKSDASQHLFSQGYSSKAISRARALPSHKPLQITAKPQVRTQINPNCSSFKRAKKQTPGQYSTTLSERLRKSSRRERSGQLLPRYTGLESNGSANLQR